MSSWHSLRSALFRRVSDSDPCMGGFPRFVVISFVYSPEEQWCRPAQWVWVLFGANFVVPPLLVCGGVLVYDTMIAVLPRVLWERIRSFPLSPQVHFFRTSFVQNISFIPFSHISKFFQVHHHLGLLTKVVAVPLSKDHVSGLRSLSSPLRSDLCFPSPEGYEPLRAVYIVSGKQSWRPFVRWWSFHYFVFFVCLRVHCVSLLNFSLIFSILYFPGIFLLPLLLLLI